MKANGAFGEAQVVCSGRHLGFQSKMKIRGIKKKKKQILLLTTANETLSEVHAFSYH